MNLRDCGKRFLSADPDRRECHECGAKQPNPVFYYGESPVAEIAPGGPCTSCGEVTRTEEGLCIMCLKARCGVLASLLADANREIDRLREVAAIETTVETMREERARHEGI